VLTVLQFAGGLALLIFGAEMFTDAAVDAARRFRVTTFLLALLVAGAEPEELLASAIASGRGMGELAISNALGTNICIVAFALALGAAIMPIRVDKSSIKHGIIALIASAFPLLFLINSKVTRVEGLLLVALFFIYVWYAVTRERLDIELEDVSTRELMGETGGCEEAAAPESDKEGEEEKPTGKSAVLVFLGLGIMGLGGNWLVSGAEGIIQLLHLSEAVVGLTFVSFATSAEMIALSVIPLYKGHPEITLGGIVGSYIYNILLTLGIAAVVRPLVFSAETLAVDFPVMVGVLAAVLLFAKKGQLGRKEGILLILGYLAYLYYTFTLR